MSTGLAGAASILALFWLAATVAVYLAARALHRRTGVALLAPALVCIAALMAILLASGRSYAEYESGGRWLSFWLGPGIVALGLPLSRQLPLIRRNAAAVLASLAAGAVVGIASAVLVAMAADASMATVRSLAPRSATTPIAMAIATQLGGIPALSAIVSIVSGAVGGSIGIPLLRAIGARSRLATGLALGGAAHGLGTARAASEGEAEGALAAMAMGVVGVLTAVLAPVVLVMLGHS